jgi:hypothetical protein
MEAVVDPTSMDEAVVVANAVEPVVMGLDEVVVKSIGWLKMTLEASIVNPSCHLPIT